MSATSDYYTILRVDPAAKREVIRAAYVSLAKENHPDAGGAAERMVALNEAWAVLGDVKRRAAYDQARRATVPRPARAARPDPRDSGTVYTPPRSGAATGSYTTRDFERYSPASRVAAKTAPRYTPGWRLPWQTRPRPSGDHPERRAARDPTDVGCQHGSSHAAGLHRASAGSRAMEAATGIYAARAVAGCPTGPGAAVPRGDRDRGGVG
jgi:curved DNA-binding protein CbpA